MDGGGVAEARFNNNMSIAGDTAHYAAFCGGGGESDWCCDQDSMECRFPWAVGVKGFLIGERFFHHQSLIHASGCRHRLMEQLNMVSGGEWARPGYALEEINTGGVLGRPTENMAEVISEQVPVRLDLDNKEYCPRQNGLCVQRPCADQLG